MEKGEEGEELTIWGGRGRTNESANDDFDSTIKIGDAEV